MLTFKRIGIVQAKTIICLLKSEQSVNNAYSRLSEYLALLQLPSSSVRYCKIAGRSHIIRSTDVSV